MTELFMNPNCRQFYSISAKKQDFLLKKNLLLLFINFIILIFGQDVNLKKALSDFNKEKLN